MATAPVSADPVVQNGGDRLLALSFSSERPVLREYDFGPAWEVLGHDPQEVDLSRLNSGAAPLLKDHRRDVDSQIGVVVSAQITGGRGRAERDEGPDRRGTGLADGPSHPLRR